MNRQTQEQKERIKRYRAEIQKRRDTRIYTVKERCTQRDIERHIDTEKDRE